MAASPSVSMSPAWRARQLAVIRFLRVRIMVLGKEEFIPGEASGAPGMHDQGGQRGSLAPLYYWYQCPARFRVL